MRLENLTSLENDAVNRFLSMVRLSEGGNLVSMKIFGSRAKGMGDEESDIDVLVLLKQCNLNIKNRIWDIANDIFLDKWVNISPLVLTKDDFEKLLNLERLIAREIEKDGIPL